MIERVVFSYFNQSENTRFFAGFNSWQDFFVSTCLSIDMASRHFPEVHMVGTKWSNDLFKQVDLPITNYSDELESMKSISQYWWARGKMIAYAMQEKPFVHIDNDVFLWKPLPKRVLEAELCFQSYEPHTAPGYGFYDRLKKSTWNKAKIRPSIILNNEVTDYSYNCGICGGHYLNIFKMWLSLSAEYIFAPENQELFFKTAKEDLIHQNLFHEQYFISSLIKALDLRSKVEVIAEDVKGIPEATENGYTHLWGTTKREKVYMSKIKRRLQKENLQLYNRVIEFCDDLKKQPWR